MKAQQPDHANSQSRAVVPVLVVTPCSAKKRIPRRAQLGPQHQPSNPRTRAVAAVTLYAGPHHLSVLRTVQRLRVKYGEDQVGLAIISARFGVLREDDRVVPYDATFSSLRRAEILLRSRSLAIRTRLSELAASYRTVIFLLSEPYLVSLEAALNVAPVEIYVTAKRPEGLGSSGVHIPAGTAEARRLGVSPRMARAALFEKFAEAFMKRDWSAANSSRVHGLNLLAT